MHAAVDTVANRLPRTVMRTPMTLMMASTTVTARKSHRDADDHAVLPNTGASDHLNLIVGTGIPLTVAGMLMVIASRRRAGVHRG
jgi:LPXTG-motif cell wall-anchored protein